MRPIRPSARTLIKAGEPIRAGEKTLFPVAEVTIWETEAAILGIMVTPIALIVVEKREEYVLSLSGREVTLKGLLEMEPSLRDAVDKAMGIHRIRVT